MNNNYMRYVTGFCVGVLLTTGINAVQTQEISVTIAKPITAQVDFGIDERLEMLKGGN